MKYGVVTFFLSISVALNAMHLSHKEQAMLDPQRVTDLVIINDVEEGVPSWAGLDSISEQGLPFLTDFLLALLEDQIVLVTKSQWLIVQNLKLIWDRYRFTHSEKILDDLWEYTWGVSGRNLEHVDRNIQAHYKKIVPQQRNQLYASSLATTTRFYIRAVQLASKLYDEISDAALQNPHHLKRALIEADEAFKKISKKNDAVVDHFFSFYTAWNAVIKSNFICKQVNQDFLLFIPATKIVHASKQYCDVDIGLSFSSLPDFDYQSIVGARDISLVMQRVKKIQGDNSLGASLVDAMKQLKIVAKSDQDAMMLPRMNVVVGGHGTKDKNTAEISIMQNRGSKSKTNDFLRFLNVLSYFYRVKALVIVSCFPGGKKFVDTFKIANIFDNAVLESISYPILFAGFFYGPTTKVTDSQTPFFVGTYEEQKLFVKRYFGLLYVGQGICNNFFYTNFFRALNQSQPDYSKAMRLFQVEGRLQEKASIKQPNTSWFVPVDLYEKDSRDFQISQIYSLLHSSIDIPPKIKQIWLKANYVPALHLNHALINHLTILPANYADQNYWIKHIDALKFVGTDVDVWLQKVMLPFVEIEEPVSLVIESLKLGIKNYKNIFVFRYFAVPGKHGFYNGYAYQDEQGVYHMKIQKCENLSDLAFVGYVVDPNIVQKWIYNTHVSVAKYMKLFQDIVKVLALKKKHKESPTLQKNKLGRAIDILTTVHRSNAVVAQHKKVEQLAKLGRAIDVIKAVKKR